MPKYRKRPIIVEAEQYLFDKPPWPESVRIYPEKHAMIETLEGWSTVADGDWIITGIKGKKYPCKPDIFEATYDELEEVDQDLTIAKVYFQSQAKNQFDVYPDNDIAAANQLLIAAAPTLLEALEDLIRQVNQCRGEYEVDEAFCLKKAHTAVAKAMYPKVTKVNKDD